MAGNENVSGSVIPFLPMLAGMGVCIWRFRAGDNVGGLAAGLAGFLLMIGLACLLDRRSAPAGAPLDVEVAPRERAHARK
jgi:hypothetical protein